DAELGRHWRQVEPHPLAQPHGNAANEARRQDHHPQRAAAGGRFWCEVFLHYRSCPHGCWAAHPTGGSRVKEDKSPASGPSISQVRHDLCLCLVLMPGCLCLGAYVCVPMSGMLMSGTLTSRTLHVSDT